MVQDGEKPAENPEELLKGINFSVDRLAKELRIIDNKIQEANWKTELPE